MADTIVTKSAAERYFKEWVRPEARIGPGVLEAFIVRIHTLSEETARKADALAQLAGRPTILERDLAEAFDTVAPVGGGHLVDPSTVFAALDRMPTEQLSELVRKIQSWLANRPE